MSKSMLSVSIDSTILEKARQTLKGNVSVICENAIRKELNIIEDAPDELKQLEELLEIKQQVQRLATQEGGQLAVRVVSKGLKKPETLPEKINFWKTIQNEAKKILIKHRLDGEKKVSPTPLPKKQAEANA